MAIGKLYEAPKTPFTPVLNAGLEWPALPQATRDAFKGPGAKVKLAAGFRLYKFTQGDIESAWGVTPWWSPTKGYQWDAGLQARLDLARNLGVSPVELTRIVAAVRSHWNKLDFILTSVLIKEVYAFWGMAGWQPREGDDTIEQLNEIDALVEKETGKKPMRRGLTGSASQFFIPNLKRGEHIRRGLRVPVADVIEGKVQIYG
ncbi:MAG: hypothetical protein ABI165_06935 [Bryobacteraceae bacterium]